MALAAFLVVVLSPVAAYASEPKARAPLGLASGEAHDQRGTNSMASKKTTAAGGARKQPPDRAKKEVGENLLRAAEEVSASLGADAPGYLRGVKLFARRIRGLEPDLEALRALGLEFQARYLAAAGPADLAASHVLLALHALMAEGGGEALEKMHALARSVLRDVAEVDTSLFVPAETARGRIATDSLAGQFDALVPLAMELTRQPDDDLAIVKASALVERAYEIVPGLLDGCDLSTLLLLELAEWLADRARTRAAAAGRSEAMARTEAETLCDALLRRMLERAAVDPSQVRRRMQFRSERTKKARRART